MILPVVLAGGAGTRLWPISREAHPKPFIRLPSGDTLLATTLRRVAALPGVERILLVTNRDYYFQTRDELARVFRNGGPSVTFLLEPTGRNTAPALALAALHAADLSPGLPLLILPADHLIEDHAAFATAVAAAAALVKQQWLVTFGVKPTYPETGFGYIEAGEQLVGGARVKRFTEKPDLATAEGFVARSDYFWNSGMFCMDGAMVLDEMQRHAAEIRKGAEICWQATRRDCDPIELDRVTFEAMPDISIDYAVMEKAERVAVVPAAFGWSDIGSWASIADLTDPDAQGNRIIGESVTVDAVNCYLHSENRLIAAVGVDNLIVVDTDDAVLVAHRDASQNVRKVVQQLKLQQHDSYRFHRTVYRPWGTFTVLEEGDNFKIKRIVVKPGASLSLQLHHHRSEHWVVVRGTAKVVNGEHELLVRTNESTYIPAGTAHRLSNPGVIECVMIEVQSGDYLGEDDIVRLEDQYGRL